MFRSVQELLNNVRNHAKASKVNITLDIDVDNITATVEDDGQGFKPENVFVQSDQAGGNKPLGLNTMRERLELLGGRLEIKSQPGQGTRLEAFAPWKDTK
jgi:signal transduction histidine kinase